MAAVHILVAPADERSVVALAQLHHDHLTYHVPFDERYQPLPARNYESVYLDLLRDPLVAVLAASVDGRMVGFASLRLHGDVRDTERPGWLASWRKRPRHTGSATLVDLFVAAESRRLGVGRALVEASMAWFREQGVSEVNLGVMADNGPGRAFWAAMGFGEYRILMRRHLS